VVLEQAVDGVEDAARPSPRKRQRPRRGVGLQPVRLGPEGRVVDEPDDGARPAVEGAGLPPRLEALLLAALDPDPDVRPRDGAAWLEGLIAVQAAMEPAPSRAGRPGPVPIRRYRLAGLALLVAAACAIGWAFLAR
jgi:hypothetical protein